MITPVIFQRLEPLSKTDRLLPVGGGDDFKAPLLKGWSTKPGVSTVWATKSINQENRGSAFAENRCCN